jgi:hypothetical protein
VPIIPFPRQTKVPKDPTPLLFHATRALKDAATDKGTNNGCIGDVEVLGDIAVPSGVYGESELGQ